MANDLVLIWFLILPRLQNMALRSDALKLDWWVFDKIKAFFENAKVNKTVSGELSGDKIVFFLHLLGIPMAIPKT